MIVQDDRLPHEKATHTVLVVGRDKFLSGWGLAKGGMSYAAWACEPQHEQRVLAWVEGRSDMKNVRVRETDYVPSGRGHFHIYVVRPGHASLLETEYGDV